MTITRTARQVLKDVYDIEADATPLYGEFDDNFLVLTGDGKKRILKIMHVGCERDRVDLQCRAMAHLADWGGRLNLPRVIPTANGEDYTALSIDGVERLVWSLSYCQGTLLSKYIPHTDGLIRSFGRTMGLVDAGLRSFSHPSMRQGHQWELTRAGASRMHVRHLARDVAALVNSTLDRFESNVASKLHTLPHSVIHNDANDNNVLVRVLENGDAVVDGLFDFGDMTYQPTVCDAAIAMAYAVLGKDDPLSVCAVFLEGYRPIISLSGEELAVLHDLVMTRLAVSIAIAAARRAENPDDLYNSASTNRAETALSSLAERRLEPWY